MKTLSMAKQLEQQTKVVLDDNAKYTAKYTWTVNFQMFKLDLEKAEEPVIKFPTSIRSSKKQESSRKTSNSVHSIATWLSNKNQT